MRKMANKKPITPPAITAEGETDFEDRISHCCKTLKKNTNSPANSAQASRLLFTISEKHVLMVSLKVGVPNTNPKLMHVVAPNVADSTWSTFQSVDWCLTVRH